MTLLIGELKGQNAEKERQNKELRDFILGRNPEIDEFYKKAIPLLGQVDIYLTKNSPVMDKLATYLDSK